MVRKRGGDIVMEVFQGRELGLGDVDVVTSTVAMMVLEGKVRKLWGGTI